MRQRLEIQSELEDARRQLAERKASLPAHSLRPSQFMELEELEDKVRELEMEFKESGG